MPDEPGAPLYLSSGWVPLQPRRVVSRWLFGWRVERLWEHRDGRREWRKSDEPVNFPEGFGRNP